MVIGNWERGNWELGIGNWERGNWERGNSSLPPCLLVPLVPLVKKVPSSPTDKGVTNNFTIFFNAEGKAFNIKPTAVDLIVNFAGFFR